MPTRRKPRVQLRIEGEGGSAVEGAEGVDIVGRGGGFGMRIDGVEKAMVVGGMC